MVDYLSDLYEGQSHRRPRELSPLIGGWPVPRDIKIEDGILFWRWGISGNSTRVNPDQKEMRREILGNFLRVADTQDEFILNHARRWGVLGLCEHGVPFGHRLYPPEDKMEGFKYGGRLGICVPKPVREYNPEPLERWRHYSRQMNALVALATTLRKLKLNSIPILKTSDTLGFRVEKVLKEDGSTGLTVHVPKNFPGKHEDWITLFHDFGAFAEGVGDPVMMGRHLISLVIEQWLLASDVRPQFVWLWDNPRFELRSNALHSGLFPVLTIQLMLLINGSPDYALCSGCSKPFLLRRGQSIARKSFCTDCGLKAARNEAVKKYLRQERENPSRKKRKRLTERQAQAIKRAKNRPGLAEQLAQKYGVSKWAIYKIREGKTWKESE